MMHPIRFNPKNGYPTGPTLYYRCKLCGVTIASQPIDSVGCRCRNIFIDIDYGRVSVDQDEKIELLDLK